MLNDPSILDFVPETVDVVSNEKITLKSFYKNYLSASKPALITGMAKEW